MKAKVLALMLGGLMVSGCTVRVADMTVASTKNYNINSAQFIKGSRVTGQDTAPVLLFPLGIPNLKTAIDKAIETNKCAVGLSDLVIYQLNHSFLVGYVGARVEGNLIIDAAQPGCGGQPSASSPSFVAPSAPATRNVSDQRSDREQQLKELARTQGLSYEEYTRRFKEINGQ